MHLSGHPADFACRVSVVHGSTLNAVCLSSTPDSFLRLVENTFKSRMPVHQSTTTMRFRLSRPCSPNGTRSLAEPENTGLIMSCCVRRLALHELGRALRHGPVECNGEAFRMWHGSDSSQVEQLGWKSNIDKYVFSNQHGCGLNRCCLRV